MFTVCSPLKFLNEVPLLLCMSCTSRFMRISCIYRLTFANEEDEHSSTASQRRTDTGPMNVTSEDELSSPPSPPHLSLPGPQESLSEEEHPIPITNATNTTTSTMSVDKSKDSAQAVPQGMKSTQCHLIASSKLSHSCDNLVTWLLQLCNNLGRAINGDIVMLSWFQE